MTWHSQYQQDRWVADIVYPGKQGGVFIDVGAHDGIWLSNTCFLEKGRGWSGILIEADDRCFEKLVINRQSPSVHVCLDESEGEVEFYLPHRTDGLGGIVAPDTDSRADRLAIRKAQGQEFEIKRVRTRTLSSVLDERSFPTRVDYLSIDIEGAELRALTGLDLKKYRIGALTIERPKAELRALLSDQGFQKIGELVHDSLFVHPEFVDVARIEAQTIPFAAAVATAHAAKLAAKRS